MELNHQNGISTDAPILPPSTMGGAHIYGEEDHKMIISIQNVEDLQGLLTLSHATQARKIFLFFTKCVIMTTSCR